VRTAQSHPVMQRLHKPARGTIRDTAIFRKAASDRLSANCSPSGLNSAGSLKTDASRSTTTSSRMPSASRPSAKVTGCSSAMKPPVRRARSFTRSSNAPGAPGPRAAQHESRGPDHPLSSKISNSCVTESAGNGIGTGSGRADVLHLYPFCQLWLAGSFFCALH
jgi:hypothetical protein